MLAIRLGEDFTAGDAAPLILLGEKLKKIVNCFLWNYSMALRFRDYPPHTALPALVFVLIFIGPSFLEGSYSGYG